MAQAAQIGASFLHKHIGLTSQQSADYAEYAEVKERVPFYVDPKAKPAWLQGEDPPVRVRKPTKTKISKFQIHRWDPIHVVLSLANLSLLKTELVATC